MISWRLELFNLLRATGTDYAYRKLQKSGGGALSHASLDCHPYGQYLTLGSTGYWGFCQGPPTPVHINLATDLASHPPPHLFPTEPWHLIHFTHWKPTSKFRKVALLSYNQEAAVWLGQEKTGGQGAS